MPRENRLYGKFTLDFADSPKIAPLTDAAFRALVEMTLYSRRMLSDGLINERVALKFWSADALDELCQNDPSRPSLIKLDGGYRIHDFEEHQTTRAQIEAKQEAGRKGGRAKAEGVAHAKEAQEQKASREGSNPGGEVVAPATDPQAVSSSNPGGTSVAKTETETETQTLKKTAPSRAQLEALFSDAWMSWPKKVDRKDALARFIAAAPKFKGREGQLVAAIKLHGEAHRLYTEPKFIPGLAVWLNKERWENPLPAPDGPGPQGKPPVKDPNAWMQPKRPTS